MRVVLVAPPWYELPPDGYGGIESMCHSLVDGLTARGHDVTLIGAGRDQTAARFIQTYREPPDGLVRAGAAFHELLHSLRAERALHDLTADVIHDHTLAGPSGPRDGRPPR